jgi:hypothetical protein
MRKLGKIKIDGIDYEVQETPIGTVYSQKVCDFFFHCHKKCTKNRTNKKCKRYQYLKKVIKHEHK